MLSLLFLASLLSSAVTADGPLAVRLQGDPIRVALAGEHVRLSFTILLPPNQTISAISCWHSLTQIGPATLAQEAVWVLAVQAENSSSSGPYSCTFTSRGLSGQDSAYLLVRDKGYQESRSFLVVAAVLGFLMSALLLSSLAGSLVLLLDWKVCRSCSQPEACPGEEAQSEEAVRPGSLYTALEPHNPSIYNTISPATRKDEGRKRKVNPAAQPQPSGGDGLFESVYENL
ncbi:NFAT activation molecule 1 isoform X1 [Lepisosteus oculatus]|uniref:NFAT activation molecule 1 isoform X1 n=1 Tax=Lepisosteus oculatus TaxID=7918 RepID=UPI0035F51C82